MSKIRLRDHFLSIEVGRSINLSYLNWRCSDCLVVDNLQFRGKYNMGREHVQLLSKHSIEMRERLDNWYNEYRAICGSFLYYLFKWLESVNAFCIDPLYEWNLCMSFIDPLYEWNLRMFFVLILYMNGICECFI